MQCERDIDWLILGPWRGYIFKLKLANFSPSCPQIYGPSFFITQLFASETFFVSGGRPVEELQYSDW